MSIVFITEKPSVAKEYRNVLEINDNERSKGYYEGESPVMKDNVIVTWAVGHLVSLCTPDKQNPDWAGAWSKTKLPMIPDKYKYTPLSGTKDQYDVVKSLYTRNDISCIYYAGDSGREGIYIQALIRNQIFKTKPKCDEKVVWISSFSKTAILEGIKTAKPYSTYQNMVNSGYARAISDWLIGMNFTQGFTLTSNKLINTGRVITPTLAMIVNRQAEIDKFTKTYFYGVQTESGITWKVVKGSAYFESDDLYNENGFLRKEDAEKLTAKCNGDKKLTVADVKVKETPEYAPFMFSLADLQTYCSKAFHFSPAKTLEIAQTLYEAKYTTYPRTDSRYLDTKTQADLASHGYNIPNRYVDDNKVTDHYAIIPDVNGLGFSKSVNSLDDDELKVYKAIEKRFLDTMKPAFMYDAVSITYKHSCGEFFFEAFRNVKQLGWREGEKGIDVTQRSVPQNGNTLPVKEFSIRNMETKPPVPFTTGSLITAMEKAGSLVDDADARKILKESKGIGTPATRSGIIERLIDKKFIEVDDKQKITPTDFGKAVVPMIAKYDETLVSPMKTADMESKLEAIASGELSYEEYLKEISQYVRQTTTTILSTQDTTFASENGGSGETYSCPKCGGDVVYGKYGWYCKSKCGFYPKQKVYGHELTDKQTESLLAGEKIVFTSNGKKTTVLPEIVEKPWNGKIYYNWRTAGSKN